MPKPSPEELQAARRRKAQEQAAEQKRSAQHNAWLVAAKERHQQLESVVEGLYDEVDKLTKKWPTMPVSQMTVDRTNKAILTVRDLLKNEGDDFIEDIHEIVPAGDLPENRDVLLTLRQIQGGLARFKKKYRDEWWNL